MNSVAKALVILLVCCICVLLLYCFQLCCFCCQSDIEGPAQSPLTYSQPSYHTPQQPYIMRIGPQYPSIQTQPSHTVQDTLSTPSQYTTPGKHKPDADAPPPYPTFQHEAAGVLGLKRGQQTKNQCRAKRK